MKCFVIILCLMVSSIGFAKVRITLDPGHGGHEKGAVHGGVIESQLALEVTRKLYKRLKKDPLFEPQILRIQDTPLSLEQRVHLTEEHNSDLFLSIHANASANPVAQGFELYIQNQLPVDEEALFLAHTEHDHSQSQKKPAAGGDLHGIIFDLKKSHKILKSYQLSHYLRQHWPSSKNRMVRQGPFYVLSQNTIPSVLIELGYLTNSRERTQLQRSSYQNQLVKKIHRGLKDYAKNMDKLPSKHLQMRNAKTR